MIPGKNNLAINSIRACLLSNHFKNLIAIVNRSASMPISFRSITLYACQVKVTHASLQVQIKVGTHCNGFKLF